MKQFTTAPTTEHELHAFQASTENNFISEVSQPRHIVAAICAMKYSYLLTYLLLSIPYNNISGE